jgi:hypothetical protein
MNITPHVIFIGALRLTYPRLELPPSLFIEAAHALFIEDHEEVLLSVSGFLELLVMTLPDGDPWREMSARTSKLTVGRIVLAKPGVACDNGSPVDHPDEQVAERPALSGAAGALLAAAGSGGWGGAEHHQTLQAHTRACTNPDRVTGVIVADTVAEAIVWTRERRDSDYYFGSLAQPQAGVDW